MVRKGGFEIHTSLDSKLQAALQNNIDTHLKGFTEVQENGKFALQGAAVCVDNRTGYVVAIVGGRGTDDEYNRGFLSRRQPGSTIKPLIDYAPAFETGFYYPSRLVNDHLFDKGPKKQRRQVLW
ncbi:penicillin-binding transpeptidase domain-containing protein [Lacrimispora xylanisolvens]|uniref:penicillin-binding transpeptidase domain-containing protein n=1 Tax=Lacrimispora xylanisolvens TaxID=384636 RepID=UPI002402733E